MTSPIGRSQDHFKYEPYDGATDVYGGVDCTVAADQSDGRLVQAPPPFREHARLPRRDSWRTTTERREERRKRRGILLRRGTGSRSPVLRPPPCEEGSREATRTFGFAGE